MSYLPENDTPTLYNNVLWVADDGSYGTGRVLAVDTSKWTSAQWDKFNELTEGFDPSIEQVLAIAEMSDTTSDKLITMFLRKSEMGDVIADFYKGKRKVTYKRLTQTECENLDELMSSLGEHIPLDNVLELRNEGYVNGWWMNNDDGNETNLDGMLNYLIELQKKEN